jgi:3-phenylpropionate/trans-cinnamate dioxygenase ferredoxin component
MGNYVKVGTVSEFKDVSKKKVTAGEKEILVVKNNNTFFAIDNKCPHMGGDLSLGKLDGTVITCPRHGSQFDVKNGQNLRWMKGSGLAYSLGKTLKSPQSVKTYPVKIVGDDITIEI